MKRIIALLLVIVSFASLTGCIFDITGSANLTKGTVDGNVYTNENLGLKFTKPASWKYYTDEEIAESMDIAVESFLEDNFSKALENNPAIIDMMAVDSATGTNINLSYENLRKSFSSNISIEKYIEALKNQTDNLSGMTVTFPDEYDKANLGGTEFVKCVCSTKAYNTTMTQVYYLHKISGYMVSIIVTIPSGYTVKEIENMFKPIEN